MLLAAGSAAAGAPPSPSAFSQTITAEPEAPAADSAIDQARQRNVERARQEIKDLQQVLDESDRRYQAASAAKPDETRQPRNDLFDLNTSPIPIPPPRNPTPRADPLKAQMRQGEPQGTAGPPKQEPAGPWLLGAMAVSAFLLLAATSAAKQGNFGLMRHLRALPGQLARWRQRHSAMLIVLGIGTIAASLTVLQPDDLPYEYREYVRGGWVAFAGVAVALIGFYDKLRRTERDEI